MFTDFRERGWERERNADRLPPIHTPTGDCTRNLGMCPDQPSRRSEYKMLLQSAEPPSQAQIGIFNTTFSFTTKGEKKKIKCTSPMTREAPSVLTSACDGKGLSQSDERPDPCATQESQLCTRNPNCITEAPLTEHAPFRVHPSVAFLCILHTQHFHGPKSRPGK